MKYSEIYEMAREKTMKCCCLDCEVDGQLEFADDEVLVCKNCGYSIYAADLQSEWQEKIEEEVGEY